MNYRFHIQNKHGKFTLYIAMNWGGRGGVSPKDFVKVSDTALPKLSGLADFSFDFEPQAQYALADLKAWLKGRQDKWNAARRKSYEQNNPFIQEYQNAKTS